MKKNKSGGSAKTLKPESKGVLFPTSEMSDGAQLALVIQGGRTDVRSRREAKEELRKYGSQ